MERSLQIAGAEALLGDAVVSRFSDAESTRQIMRERFWLHLYSIESARR